MKRNEGEGRRKGEREGEGSVQKLGRGMHSMSRGIDAPDAMQSLAQAAYALTAVHGLTAFQPVWNSK